MSASTITSKGQITIPADIRKRLDLKPGDKIDFQVEPNGTVRIFACSRKASDVFGLLAQKGRPARTVEELDDQLCKKFREGSI